MAVETSHSERGIEMKPIPEQIEVGMVFGSANPVFSSSETIEVAKIDHHGIWLERESGVMIRTPITRAQLVAYDYGLIEQEGHNEG